jgi:hypothetical protein
MDPRKRGTMGRYLWTGILGAALLLGGFAALPVRAEHFDILLVLKTSRGQAQSSWDTEPPEGGLNPRQSITAAAGEQMLLEWSMISEFPHGIMRGVITRLWVAPEAAIGQKALPLSTAPRVLDNSFTMDYLPDHQAHGHVRFRVTEPGNYLVRLDSEDTQKEHGHEHFAALDLKVE